MQLILSGCIRTGADVAKALVLGCNSDTYYQNGALHTAEADYAALHTAPGYCHHCHTGKCPVGVTTQDQVLEQRVQPEEGARRARNYFKTLNMELTTRAPAASKTCTTWNRRTWSR